MRSCGGAFEAPFAGGGEREPPTGLDEAAGSQEREGMRGKKGGEGGCWTEERG